MADTDEFAHFVETKSRQLQRAAWLLCGNWSSAEDLTQTTLFAVWTHWAEIRRTDSPQIYAHRVLVNAYLRGSRRRWTGEMPSAEVPDGPDLVDETERVELREGLLRALGKLPPRQRSVLVLRYFLDQPERSVATLLGCSTGAVKSHSAKAIATLRKSDLLADLLTDGAEQ
jgi:RNA polymerase sigma-70 factor (sigma-E family)